MPNQKNSSGEVQQAIRQGAITREYKGDAQRIVQALNALRSTEIMSYLQYMQHQYMAVSMGAKIMPIRRCAFFPGACRHMKYALGIHPHSTKALM